MIETTDGFEIAERDLQLRGPGDFFGTRQAGVPTFRLVDLDRDGGLIDEALQEAEQSFSHRRAHAVRHLPAPAFVVRAVQADGGRVRRVGGICE